MTHNHSSEFSKLSNCPARKQNQTRIPQGWLWMLHSRWEFGQSCPDPTPGSSRIPSPTLPPGGTALPVVSCGDSGVLSPECGQDVTLRGHQRLPLPGTEGMRDTDVTAGDTEQRTCHPVLPRRASEEHSHCLEESKELRGLGSAGSKSCRAPLFSQQPQICFSTGNKAPI